MSAYWHGDGEQSDHHHGWVQNYNMQRFSSRDNYIRVSLFLAFVRNCSGPLAGDFCCSKLEELGEALVKIIKRRISSIPRTTWDPSRYMCWTYGTQSREYCGVDVCLFRRPGVGEGAALRALVKVGSEKGKWEEGTRIEEFILGTSSQFSLLEA